MLSYDTASHNRFNDDCNFLCVCVCVCVCLYATPASVSDSWHHVLRVSPADLSGEKGQDVWHTGTQLSKQLERPKSLWKITQSNLNFSCISICGRVCCVYLPVQEEPEDLSDSSHPAIVPLKDAPPVTEVESHSPAPNYITVHYSKLSRCTPSPSISLRWPALSFCCLLLQKHSDIFCPPFTPSVSWQSCWPQQQSTVSCLACYRFYFTTALALLLSSLFSCHLYFPRLVFSSVCCLSFVISNTFFCLWEHNKFLIPVLDLMVLKRPVFMIWSESDVWMNSYGLCLLLTLVQWGPGAGP